MEQYLKSYQVIMHTVGPVFVGSGRNIGKKEYLFLSRSQAAIPDIGLLYAELKKRKKGDEFEKYLLGKENISLTKWLESQHINFTDLDALVKYKLDCGGAVLQKDPKRLEIKECIKDAYGMPYIPGSSLKGMLRTVLLGAELIKNSDKYQKNKEIMRQNAEIKKDRKYYLSKDIENIESSAFRMLDRPGSQPKDAVNDILQGLVVSDSEPLLPEDLTLCQKIDVHPDGAEKELPILRECIKPNTEIRFSMTVDTSICKLSSKLLMESVKLFMDSYNQNFVQAFKGMDVLKTNDILCGGGCGFVSKTVIYPMYGKREGIEMAKCIFDKTGVPDKHRHYKDAEYGASPHTIKCTRYQGKLYQMGVCRIKKIKLMS